jgi:hypothetical protein
MEGILGLIEMIHIRMRWMRLICLMKIMMLLGHPLRGQSLKKMWIMKDIVIMVMSRVVRLVRSKWRVARSLMRIGMMVVKMVQGLVPLLGQV